VILRIYLCCSAVISGVTVIVPVLKFVAKKRIKKTAEE
jgi:hypothetical protein